MAIIQQTVPIFYSLNVVNGENTILNDSVLVFGQILLIIASKILWGEFNYYILEMQGGNEEIFYMFVRPPR